MSFIDPILPRYTEPVSPNIPDIDIYEDEDE